MAIQTITRSLQGLYRMKSAAMMVALFILIKTGYLRTAIRTANTLLQLKGYAKSLRPFGVKVTIPGHTKLTYHMQALTFWRTAKSIAGALYLI